MHDQQQSRLMRLPVELQLVIFEYVVVEDEPLLINYGCDSNYPNDPSEWEQVRDQWLEGEILPPFQPGLTQTCTALRELTLPMFYRQNAFRGHYCYRADLNMVVKWLKMIGMFNRLLLRDLCLVDWNENFDYQHPPSILQAMRSDVCRKLGGNLETLRVDKCCCHRITFVEDKDLGYYDAVPFVLDGVSGDEG